MNHDSTSQVTVTKNLHNYLREVQEGGREASVVSTQTVESLSPNVKETWRAIRKELEEIGITVAAFDLNKDFIINWFKEALADGAFEIQMGEGLSQALGGDLNRELKDRSSVCHQATAQDFATPGTTSRDYSVPRDHASWGGQQCQGSAVVCTPDVDLRIIPAKSSSGDDIALRETRTPQPLIPQSPRPAASTSFPNNALPVEPPNSSFKSPSKQRKDSVSPPSSNGRTARRRARLPRLAALVVGLIYSGEDLLRATKKGDTVKIRKLLENGIDVNRAGSGGWTALQWAIVNGDEAAVRLLVDKGADIEAKTGTGWTVLQLAVDYQDEAMVKLLVEKGANIETDRGGHTALSLAAVHGYEAMVLLLIQMGAGVNAKGGFAFPALYGASSNGHEAVARLLIEKGVDGPARGVPEWA